MKKLTIMKSGIALLTMLLTFTFISCEKPEVDEGKEEQTKPEVEKTDTPEDILIGVASCYTVDSVAIRENDYLITFAKPSPISLNKDYPTGIKEVSLEKTSVKEFSDDGHEVLFTFIDEKTVKLSYDSWLEVEFSRNMISFDEQRTPDTLAFTVINSKPDTVSVWVNGGDRYVTCETVMAEDGKSGKVIFTPSTEAYFTDSLYVIVTNDKKNRSQKVSLIRENFKFDDGTLSQSYSFREYERYFTVKMSKADKTVEAVVADDCKDWLKTRMSNEKFRGVDETKICILMAENVGNRERTGHITVRKAGSERELSIEINQIATEMEGSLRKALIAFYDGLNGSSWAHNDNWCSDKPLLEWYGISASDTTSKESMGETGYAYNGTDDAWSLKMYRNNIRGEIPMEFWEMCPCFESISIKDEYLPTSTVPDCVWHEGLRFLDLSYSFMNVPLSSAVGKAKNLERLNLDHCNVGCDIPAEITELSNLELLNMVACGLTGTLPQSLGNLKKLRWCYLHSNPALGGTLPDNFYEMTRLDTFWIAQSKIGGTLSKKIINMTALGSFDIRDCEFEGTIPEEFGMMNNIIQFSFDGNYFTELPQFIRYIGVNCRHLGTTSAGGTWYSLSDFPVNIPYRQRNKEDGRPDNYIKVKPNGEKASYILVDGEPLRYSYYSTDHSICHMLPLPVWAHIRYDLKTWELGALTKHPQYPYGDDLQYPANEYYYDGKDWRHPKLEYPAREYYYDGNEWVHDPTCPWDAEYIY